MEATLGKRISANRKKLGLTQDQLAEKLGVTPQAVSKWENNLSCPDISILPTLADIFHITIDELLGREPANVVLPTDVIREDKRETGFTFDNGKLDLHWNYHAKVGIGFACWILLTGILYLVAQLANKDVSFWNIAWPALLSIFGLSGLYPKFSVFRLGCALVGCYFLVVKLQLLSVDLDSGILIAIAVILLGLSLLVDTVRRHKNRMNTCETEKQHKYTINDYTVDGKSFSYDASFGGRTQIIKMDMLHCGSISTNFGEYTVDLSGVRALEEPCHLSVDCSFGELTILIPSQYTIVPESSTSFAGFEIQGEPDPVSKGYIHLNASVSFGEICIRYL